MSDYLKSGKALVFATVAGVILFLQLTMLTAALDFMTSIILVLVGFVAGRSSK